MLNLYKLPYNIHLFGRDQYHANKRVALHPQNYAATKIKLVGIYCKILCFHWSLHLVHISDVSSLCCCLQTVLSPSWMFLTFDHKYIYIYIYIYWHELSTVITGLHLQTKPTSTGSIPIPQSKSLARYSGGFTVKQYGLVGFPMRIIMFSMLVGGIPRPLKNDGVRQLGWWHSQYMGK